MAYKLRKTVVNMKTLSQDIESPIVVNAADMEGRKLRVIFTQEAAARFTPTTKVYLSWYHQEADIKGYNVFTEIIKEDDDTFPPTWEITFPKTMLYEGNVLACLEIVDDISISVSKNFIIHVLRDPNDGSNFIKSDDYSAFQDAVLIMNNLSDEVSTEFNQMREEFAEIQDIIQDLEYNTVASTDEIILTESDHIITGTIGEIAASKIVYRQADQEHSITKQTVAQAIDDLQTALTWRVLPTPTSS